LSIKGMEPDDQLAQENGKTLPVSGNLFPRSGWPTNTTRRKNGGKWRQADIRRRTSAMRR
jgi:hypothetical protein